MTENDMEDRKLAYEEGETDSGSCRMAAFVLAVLNLQFLLTYR